MKVLIPALIAFVVAACGSAGTTSTATPTPRATYVNPVNPPAATPEPEVTPEPAGTDSGPSTVKVGQAVSITCDGVDCMRITVLKTTSATRYKDPDGFLDDTPEHKGYVFIGVQVRYEATGPDADYNEFDWALYVNDEQVQDTAFVDHGPSPQLSANTLPKGKKVSGWIFWEVPKTGRAVLSYEPGRNGSIFEVVVRSK